MSPTVLQVKGYRFYFFSREERRGHVHVQHADGEAKFWIDPDVELAANFSLKAKQVAEAPRESKSVSTLDTHSAWTGPEPSQLVHWGGWVLVVGERA